MNSYEHAQQQRLAYETAAAVEEHLEQSFDLDAFASTLRSSQSADFEFNEFERPAAFPKMPGLALRFYGKRGDGIVETPVEPLHVHGVRHTFDKREDLHQPGHNYKVHGARYSLLDALKTDPAARIMATASAGNHGISLAVAVNEMNTRLPGTLQRETHIYCREDISPVKRAKLEELGAYVFAKYQTLEEAIDAVSKITDRDPNQKLIHPFDQVLTIAGQATITFEHFAALKSRGIDVRHPLQEYVPVGGGGLLAGKAIAHRLLKKWGVMDEASLLYGVEVEQNDSMARALEGRPSLVAPTGKELTEHTLDSDCDGTATLSPGVLTQALVGEFTNGVRVIPKEYLVRACGALASLRDRAPELAGSLSLGGLLYDLDQRPEESTRLHLTTTTGGNISRELLGRLSAEYLDSNVDIRTKVAALALRRAAEASTQQQVQSAAPEPQIERSRKSAPSKLKVWSGYTTR